MRASKGNMYRFCSHTHNPIKGKCSHDCIYCYMKIFLQKPIRLDETELNENLGEGNIIFIGSSTDVFAEDVPKEWIMKVFEQCKKFNNTYLFQSKNPGRMAEFLGFYPHRTIFGTTIESNRDYGISKAPDINLRQMYFRCLPGRRMITLEPLMDFDLKEFVDIIKSCEPEWVNIGADSKNHNLPEPSKEKILALIKELSQFTKVIQKDNLRRLLK